MTIITAQGSCHLPHHLETMLIIVGAGPVGLALALDLGLQGIDLVLLDGELRGQSEDRVRRANAINNRAMEYMRRLGLAADINAAATQELEQTNLDVSFVTSLTGYELARFVNAFESSPDLPPEGLSPETYRRINQIDIEAMLRERIAALSNVTCIEGARFDEIKQDETGVEAGAALLGSNRRLTLRAAFLIGCDGGTSSVRKLADFKLEGRGALARNLNITFRGGDVYDANIHPYASMYWVVNSRFDGYISPTADGGRLTLFGVDDARFAAISADPLPVIAAAVGRPVAVEPVSFDRWQTHHLVARNYQRGRVFLAGDAAHMHPPTGGLGMNTGLGDASNLGWKIGAFLSGWAGEAMLASYDAERRPVGARVVAQSNHQYNQPASSFYHPDLELDNARGKTARAAAAQDILTRKATEFFSRGLVLGQTYVPSPIVIAEDGALINQDVVTYIPTAQAGARLPHIYIGSDSLYDLLHPQGYSLIIGAGAQEAQIAAMERMLVDAHIPHRLLRLPPDQAEIYEAPYLLVRPDAHVAWRGHVAFSQNVPSCISGHLLAQAA